MAWTKSSFKMNVAKMWGFGRGGGRRRQARVQGVMLESAGQ